MSPSDYVALSAGRPESMLAALAAHCGMPVETVSIHEWSRGRVSVNVVLPEENQAGRRYVQSRVRSGLPQGLELVSLTYVTPDEWEVWKILQS